MQQPLLNDEWGYRPMVGKLYLNQNDSINLPAKVLQSLIIWVEPDEPEDAERDAKRERDTVHKATVIMSEHKHDTWCNALGVWLKTTPSVGVANAAYRHIYGMYLPLEHKEWAEKAVEAYGLENWAEALLNWRGNAYNPNNIHGIIGKAKQFHGMFNRGELPKLAEVDPIFLQQETEGE